jgi:hypothetical protein
MIAKGRDSFDWMSRGENNGHTHLTDEQVMDIRRKLAAGMTQGEVGEQYLIGQTTVSHINLGNTWTHLLPDDYAPVEQRRPCGEDHARHKLTEDEAIQIRKLALSSSNQPGDNQHSANSLSLLEIGKMFGVDKRTVLDIKIGWTWKHLWNDATTESESSVTANMEN